MSGETQQAESVSAWTTDTLHELVLTLTSHSRELFEKEIEGLRVMLLERYETQTKAVDAAFAAQQLAMTTALAAAERAVQAALQAAEKAVTKAEVASEKRFESVNEFRAQLGDQANTFIARTEADARISALADKFEGEATRNASRFSEGIQRINDVDARLSSRMDLTQGATKGVDKTVAFIFAAVGFIATVVGIVATVIALN